MKKEQIECGKFYECKSGNSIFPLYVYDILPNGISGKNLNSNREVFIKCSQLIKQIENLNEWRLHNGD